MSDFISYPFRAIGTCVRRYDGGDFIIYAFSAIGTCVRRYDGWGGLNFTVPKRPCVYLLASYKNGTLYVGVSSDLRRRLEEHEQGLVEGFTKKYNVKRLVYFEFHASMIEAIRREKQLKKWKREWKIQLIEGVNPEWRNLRGEIPFDV